MPNNDPARTLHLFSGSLALAWLAQSSECSECGEKFKKLPSQLRERLETYANVKIVKDIENHSNFGFRFPRIWQPVGIDDELSAGHWVFPEFDTPMIFQFHLPRKLQNAVFSGAGNDHNVEEFWIAYDGMLFVGACEVQGENNLFWLPAMVRKYLQTELLKTVGAFTAVVIPPSPMHVQVDLEIEKRSDSVSKRPQVDWDSQYHLLTIRNSRMSEIGISSALELIYAGMQLPLRLFYHAEIDKIIADGLRHRILSEVSTVYQEYEESLDLPTWNLAQRWRTQGNLSRKIGGIQYSFCEHTLALSSVRQSQERVRREIHTSPLMTKTEEYFRSMTEPEGLNYDLYTNTLEHIRSHLFVLSQNKQLIYAALAGALVTLLGTILGYFIHR